MVRFSLICPYLSFVSHKSSCFSERIHGPEVQIEPSVSITAPRSLGDLFNAMDSSASGQETEDDIEKEIKWYSSLPVVQDKNHDVLAWWSKHATTFPRLALLARKYLCGTATSVPSERLFSAAGYIVSDRRSCLKPATVNMLCFLAANL